jgi:hypothetical protein
MTSSETAITNLLYSYAEAIDRGDFTAAAGLFSHATLKTQNVDTLLNSKQILAFWQSGIQIYPCGTPRTKHVITNPIININGNSAKVRSYYSVYQATDKLPLQLICAGRYHDEFEQVNSRWRFKYRDYTLLDLTGDLSHHLSPELLENQSR